MGTGYYTPRGRDMNRMRVFIFGAGYSARVFALARQEAHLRIAGTTRSPDKFDALREAGIEPFLFDGAALSDEAAAELAQATHLILSIAPEEGGDPVLNVAGGLVAAMPHLRWIGYLSTVGVYGDHDGAWIDETAECRPTSPRSRRRLMAENAWIDLGRRIDLPVAILRLSGIYGPGRNAFVNLTDGTARRLVKEGQMFNRIHVDDIAGALWHLAEREAGGVFNVTDDLPAPPQDVIAYAAELMGIAPPPEQPFETAELSPMARSFYGENKRISNAAIKAAGFGFRHPDYFSAFSSMWQAGNWAAPEGRRSAIKTA